MSDLTNKELTEERFNELLKYARSRFEAKRMLIWIEENGDFSEYDSEDRWLEGKTKKVISTQSLYKIFKANNS